MSTTYVVLALLDPPPPETSGDSWEEIGREKAHNPRQAIQLCLLGDPSLRAQAYVAVPERNFKPEKPRVEQVQKVVFGSTLAEAEEEK